MLTKQDLRFNFATFRLSSLCCWIPVEFQRDGRMRARESRKRWGVYYCFLFNGILYWAYLFLRLLQSLLLPDDSGRTSVVSIIPHGLVLGGVTITIVWNMQTYILSPAISTIVFNEVVTLLESSNVQRKVGLQELTTRLVPIICLYLTLVPMVPYALSPESYQTVYSLLSEMGFGSIWLLSACAVYEYWTFFFLMNTFNVGGLVHLVFLQATAEELKALVTKLSSGANRRVGRGKILKHVRALRIIQLRVTYFSRVYSLLIHLLKLECMFDGVAGLFIFIKFWDSNPILAALGICVGCVDSTAYCLMYGRAFEIPMLLKDCKNHLDLLLPSRSVGSSEDERREVRQLLRSIPDMGIMVGEFHELKQATDVEYFEFIISSVVDLLITFPGPLKV